MDPGLNKLSAALDALVLRQKITASNIANIDTEGYNKRRVEFEKHLKEAKLNGDSADIDINQLSGTCASNGGGCATPNAIITLDITSDNSTIQINQKDSANDS